LGIKKKQIMELNYIIEDDSIGVYHVASVVKKSTNKTVMR